MEDRLADQHTKWSRLAEGWHEAAPPATPSSSDLNILRAAVAAGTTPHDIAVLGSTIGIRRAFGADPNLRAARLWIVDFSSEMVESTKRLLPIDDTRESVLRSDWLSLGSMMPASFDACVGDKAIDNVAWDDWPAFFTSMHVALRPRGRLVLHVGLPDPSLAGRSFEALVARWTDRILRGGMEISSAAAGLWEDLLSASATQSDRFLTLARYHASYAEARARATGVAAKLLLALGEDFAPTSYAWWTRFNLEELCGVASRGFDVEAIKYADDYDAAPFQPSVIFSKRG